MMDSWTSWTWHSIPAWSSSNPIWVHKLIGKHIGPVLRFQQDQNPVTHPDRGGPFKCTCIFLFICTFKISKNVALGPFFGKRWKFLPMFISIFLDQINFPCSEFDQSVFMEGDFLSSVIQFPAPQLFPTISSLMDDSLITSPFLTKLFLAVRFLFISTFENWPI